MMDWGIGTVYEVLEWAIRIGALVVIPFKRKTTAAAWLLFLFLLPIPGLLLFLAIGQPRFPRWRTERFKKLRPFFESVSGELRVASTERLGAVADTAELAIRLGGFPPVAGNAIEFIDEIPRTSAGKFRKSALRERFCEYYGQQASSKF